MTDSKTHAHEIRDLIERLSQLGTQLTLAAERTDIPQRAARRTMDAAQMTSAASQLRRGQISRYEAECYAHAGSALMAVYDRDDEDEIHAERAARRTVGWRPEDAERVARHM